MQVQFNVIEHTWIVLPDGRRLASKLWMPIGAGPFPAILEYLPYRIRDGTASIDATTHPVFASNGYVSIRVDIAGTGDSEGLFDDEYSEQELKDGEAVLSWIAAQHWCDGNIGMIGISWGGFNGLQLAFRQPVAQKAVVSVASTTDRYADDVHYMGGCLLVDNFNWASQMFAIQTLPLDPTLRSDWREEWLNRMSQAPFLAATWMAHPTRDYYWKHGSVCEDYARIKTPVLAITGWADSYVNAPPQLVESMSAPAKAIIGPWEHQYSHLSKLDPSDFHGEVVRWFDCWMKGAQNGAEALPDYRTFMQEHDNAGSVAKSRRGRWIAEATWPSDNITREIMPLGQGSLGDSATQSVISVATPAHVGLESGYFTPELRVDNELPGDQSKDDALSICFDTSPLDQPMELMGRAILKIEFSVNQPVAQVVVRLCDVSPSGVSQRVTYRGFNLNHHSSHEVPEVLVPGQRYNATIELNECAHRLRAGHKLRLALSNSYWPIVWPAPKPVELVLHLANCWVDLPVRLVTQEIEAMAPAAAINYPTLKPEIIREPSNQTQNTTLDDGTVVQQTSGDFGASRDPDHGLETSSEFMTRHGIHPDDPSSAQFETQWTYCFGRGNWQVEIETSNTMTCDADNFYLHRKLSAVEGAERIEVLTKEWSTTIAREFL